MRGRNFEYRRKAVSEFLDAGLFFESGSGCSFRKIKIAAKLLSDRSSFRLLNWYQSNSRSRAASEFASVISILNFKF